MVDAVLSAQGRNPYRASQAVPGLSAWVERPDWDALLPAYARCVRITRDLDQKYPLAEGRFEEEAETALYEALIASENEARALGSVDDFLTAFAPLIPQIDKFFDQVLVMVEDEQVRENRLGLLQRISAMADGVVDMSKLEGF